MVIPRPWLNLQPSWKVFIFCFRILSEVMKDEGSCKHIVDKWKNLVILMDESTYLPNIFYALFVLPSLWFSLLIQMLLPSLCPPLTQTFSPHSVSLPSLRFCASLILTLFYPHSNLPSHSFYLPLTQILPHSDLVLPSLWQYLPLTLDPLLHFLSFILFTIERGLDLPVDPHQWVLMCRKAITWWCSNLLPHSLASTSDYLFIA